VKNSCITYPERDPLVVIRKSQVEFCDGNVCAAALLSFFEYWHNIKLEMAPKSAALNVIAMTHGEEGCHDDSLYQFHKMDELSKGVMGLYGREAIKTARALLKEKGVITEHRNPTQRYTFDNTVYFLFHPEIVCEWLNIRYNQNPSYRHTENSSSIEPEIVISTCTKTVDRHHKNGGPSSQKQPIYRTEITTEITTERVDQNLVDLPKTQKSAKPKKAVCVIEASEVVREIFTYWQMVMDHSRTPLTPARIELINKWLVLGYAKDMLMMAIKGCASNYFNMGDNDNGKVYNDLGLIFRDEKHIDSFIQDAKRPPVKKLSFQEQKDRERKARDAEAKNENFMDDPNPQFDDFTLDGECHVIN